MVSPLSPVQIGRPEKIDLVGSYLGGQNAFQQGQMNEQAIKQNEQQISREDYDRAQQRLSVIGRLAAKARSFKSIEERQQFAQSLNPQMLQSVGIDPASIASIQLDDKSLDGIIAQAQSSLPESNQFRKESVSTNQGLMVFDPSTGGYSPATGEDGKPLTGAQYDPNLQGQIASAKQTGQNNSDLALKPQIAAATETAKAGVEMATKPQIEGATTKARTEAEQAAIKRQTQEVGTGKLEEADVLYKSLSSANLDKIYGRGESAYPELLRSQEGIDLIAKRDQLVSMLKLGARGELKGQGSITDTETKMLSDAATILGNANISPGEAKAALDRAMDVLRRNAGKTNSDSKELSLDDLLSKY